MGKITRPERQHKIPYRAGLPEKFGVQGFPTLIVIDAQGQVHDLHVGYTPTLRENVGRQIKKLLEKK